MQNKKTKKNKTKKNDYNLLSFEFELLRTTIRAEKMVDGDVITTSDTHAHRVHDISHKLLNTK